MSDIKMCVFTILFTKTEKRCSSNHAVLRAIYRRRPNAEKGHVNIQLYTRVTLTHTGNFFINMGSKIWRKNRLSRIKICMHYTHLHVRLCVYTCVSAHTVAQIIVSILYQFKWNFTKPNIIRHVVFVVSTC